MQQVKQSCRWGNISSNECSLVKSPRAHYQKRMVSLLDCLHPVSDIWVQTNCRVSSASGPQSPPLQMAEMTEQHVRSIRTWESGMKRLFSFPTTLPCDISAPDWTPREPQRWRGLAPQKSWTQCRIQQGMPRAPDCSQEPERSEGRCSQEPTLILWYSHYGLVANLLIVKNPELQADHGQCSIQQSPIWIELPAVHQIRLKVDRVFI